MLKLVLACGCYPNCKLKQKEKPSVKLTLLPLGHGAKP